MELPNLPDGTITKNILNGVIKYKDTHDSVRFYTLKDLIESVREDQAFSETKPEKNLFSYHYSAMYTIPNGAAYHDGVVTTNRKIKTHEEYEELKKDISPDNAHKMSITSLSFLGLVKEDGMTEEIDSNEKTM